MNSVLKRPTETMHGTLISADFPADTITLEMEPGYYTAKMRFAVVPADEYTRQCEQRAEFLDLLSDVMPWLRGALDCKEFVWDEDLHESAETVYTHAATYLAAIANATQKRNATGGEG